MNFEISQALCQQILNYLASKPYAEVFQLIEKLRSLPVVPPPDKIEEDKNVEGHG